MRAEGEKGMAKMQFRTAFNSFKALSVIGQGGNGTVYKVQDDDGQISAVKVLDPVKATTEKVKRFKNEIQFCGRTRHKNIVTVVDYGIVTIKGTDTLFYVMPFYASTLRAIIDRKPSPQAALNYFSQILDGVEAAHLKSVWHRDLKPENILHDPDSDTLVVADFGIAHFSEEFLRTFVETEPHDRLANFQYAAPEQRRRGEPVDQRADIFALGQILYELFSGLLLQGSNPHTIGSTAPDYSYLDDPVGEMTRQQPLDRIASIDSVKQKLIGYKNEFVSRQRLSSLSKQVIPQAQVDDPLIANPVTLVGVDYLNRTLVFILNQRVNSDWQHEFQNIGNYSFYQGVFEPSHIRFSGEKATIELGRDADKGMVEMFKDYLSKANAAYRDTMTKRQRDAEAAQRKRLQIEIDEERKRQEFLKTVRI
jgi:serine/threonine protein kinase